MRPGSKPLSYVADGLVLFTFAVLHGAAHESVAGIGPSLGLWFTFAVGLIAYTYVCVFGRRPQSARVAE